MAAIPVLAHGVCKCCCSYLIHYGGNNKCSTTRISEEKRKFKGKPEKQRKDTKSVSTYNCNFTL